MTLGICLTWLLLGCGKETNIFHYLTPKDQQESFDNLLARGRAYYDNGDFDAALLDAEKAHEMNPKSESASLLVGYVYLAKAGISPFELARRMIGDDKDKEESSEDTKGEGAGGVLGSLSEVLGLTNEELIKLGTLDTSVPEYPVIVPGCADLVRTLNSSLTYVNKGIAAICPFVSERVKLQDDHRHVCDTYVDQAQNEGKLNFLWAFSHLTEALAFHSVLTYNTNGSSQTNLEKRGELVKGVKVETPDEITDFLDQVTSLEQTVANILPVEGKCSEKYVQTQLTALINDMLTVNITFANMPGVPASITESIEKSMEKIQEVRNESSADSGETNKAMKGDLTKKMGESLSAKIDELEQGGQDVSEEQKDSICSAYSSITGGEGEAPSLCL